MDLENFVFTFSSGEFLWVTIWKILTKSTSLWYEKGKWLLVCNNYNYKYLDLTFSDHIAALGNPLLMHRLHQLLNLNAGRIEVTSNGFRISLNHLAWRKVFQKVIFHDRLFDDCLGTKVLQENSSRLDVGIFKSDFFEIIFWWNLLWNGVS